MSVTVFGASADQVTAARFRAVVDSLAGNGDSVAEGFELTDGGGLNVDVEAGLAIIAGYLIESDAVITEALTASQTNYVYLESDGSITVNTTGTPPSDSILLGRAVTDGSGITSLLHTGMLENAAAAYIIKTAEETNSTTTYSSDTELRHALSPGETWEFEVHLDIRNTTAGNGFKFRLKGPSGQIRASAHYYLGTSTKQALLTNAYNHTANVNSSEVALVSVSTSLGANYIYVRGVITVGETAGNLAVQFAENSTGGAAAGVGPNSYMVMRRLRV